MFICLAAPHPNWGPSSQTRDPARGPLLWVGGALASGPPAESLRSDLEAGMEHSDTIACGKTPEPEDALADLRNKKASVAGA